MTEVVLRVEAEQHVGIRQRQIRVKQGNAVAERGQFKRYIDSDVRFACSPLAACYCDRTRTYRRPILFGLRRTCCVNVVLFSVNRSHQAERRSLIDHKNSDLITTDRWSFRRPWRAAWLARHALRKSPVWRAPDLRGRADPHRDTSAATLL